MHSKSKNKNRNSSASKQHRSNAGSISKEKHNLNKYKTQKCIIVKSKLATSSKNSKLSDQPKVLQKQKQKQKQSYLKLNLKNNLKNNKPEEPSEEYYNQIRKSKSKGKILQIAPQEVQKQKVEYFNGLYMHKQDGNLSNLKDLESQILQQHIGNAKSIQSKGSHQLSSSALKKMKLIERSAIDSNGKFISKEVKKHTHKHTDSNTVSMFQNNSKRNINVGNNQSKKPNIKKIKKAQGNSNNETGFSNEQNETDRKFLKSISKLKKHNSGKDKDTQNSITQNYFSITQNEQTKNQSIMSNSQQLNSFRKTREATRLQTQRQTIQTSSTKTIQSVQTQSSPHFVLQAIKLSQFRQNICYQQVIQQIKSEKIKNYCKFSLTTQFFSQRIKIIDYIAKISHHMSMRRQAFCLAVSYMDRYLDILLKQYRNYKKSQFNENDPKYLGFLSQIIQNMKLMVIACMLIASKMQDGLMARKFCYQINTNPQTFLNSFNKPMLGKVKSKESFVPLTNEHASFKSQRKQSLLISNKSKGNLSSKQIQQKQLPKKVKKQVQISMNNILAMEIQITKKFQFKLMEKTSQYWIDMLTFLWDQYINEQASWQEVLYFRQENSTTIFSHLIQLSEKSYFTFNVYNFSTSTLIFSIMYLIIRMRLEVVKNDQNIKNIYQKYRQNLSKSSNIIFYDNVGINELYGDFLMQFDLNMSDIVDCVKFVGSLLTQQSLKIFSYSYKSKQINNKYELHGHRLSLYQYNPQIYQAYLQKQKQK